MCCLITITDILLKNITNSTIDYTELLAHTHPVYCHTHAQMRVHVCVYRLLHIVCGTYNLYIYSAGRRKQTYMAHNGRTDRRHRSHIRGRGPSEVAVHININYNYCISTINFIQAICKNHTRQNNEDPPTNSCLIEMRSLLHVAG